MPVQTADDAEVREKAEDAEVRVEPLSSEVPGLSVVSC